MKVSSKVTLGFFVLMALAVVVLLYQISVIQNLRISHQDLSQINVESARNILEMQRLAQLIADNSKRYFALRDDFYERLIVEFRNSFLEHLVRLRQTATSDREQAEAAKLSDAMDSFWREFNQLKQQKDKSWDPEELPPNIVLAMSHLEAQSEVMLDAVQLAIDGRSAQSEQLGQKAAQVSLIAGIFSFLLGGVVAAVIVRSINVPLRRLILGTRAITRGEFWHRLPSEGSDELTELARSFNTMTERLGELDRMKKDFVSHVSHDLKAPLASIRQVMYLLLQEIPGSLNEQQKNLMQLSYNSAERLAAMVGNLLDVSRMEAGAMEYRMAAHDLVALIKHVAGEFDMQAREKEIQFRFECDLPSVQVECDRDRIVQVIGNLYENALKFSPNHSEIVTRVGQGRGDEILISVSDSGPGVPAGHKEKIFQKFHQVKYGKKITGQGVGLGLAICKTIVEAHRGQIWVEDNPAGGSVFSFVLHPATQEVLKCGQSA